jgi:CubicO group peptidase (beta-lactamase class C family)
VLISRIFGGISVRKVLAVGAFVICCLAVFLAANAATLTPEDTQVDAQVDALVRGEMKKQHIPGLALGVYRDGKIVRAQGYGFANLEWDVPVKPDTLFQSGSVGKQFVATAILMLVEEGKIGLDDPVLKYFSDSPDIWKNIKIRNLLTHTSGLSEYESEERSKPGGPFDLRLDFTEDELYAKIKAMPLDFQPGEKWDYRNTNYVLLGFLLHKLTGKFYADYLQERIFKPLGMTSTRLISEEDIIPHRAAGYRLVKGELKNQEWVSPTFNSTADGALYFTVLDLEKWDAALYTEKLLKKSSLEQMWTPVTLNNGKHYPYGFGWGVEEINGHRLIQHGGAWQGFTTDISRYVDDRLTVVVLTNLDAGHSDPEKIAHGVAGIYLPAVKPVELKPIPDNEPQVTALFRATLADMVAGHPNLDSFTATERNDWPAEKIKNVSDFLKALGDLKSVELVERTEDNGARVYKYRVAFAERTLLLAFRLDKDSKFFDWHISPD